jgi:hypothetical protein
MSKGEGVRKKWLAAWVYSKETLERVGITSCSGPSSEIAIMPRLSPSWIKKNQGKVKTERWPPLSQAAARDLRVL